MSSLDASQRRKSSHSTATGNCVEWRKSSHSHANGNCIEWRKSSHSTANNGGCVEVRSCEVRDSKAGEGSPVLSFTESTWQAFIADIKAGKFR